jgi:small-conductance mechanosensitive channel
LKELIDQTDKFADYAAERTLWLRSAPVIGYADLTQAVTLLGEFCNTSHWWRIGTFLVEDSRRNITSTILVGVALVFWVVAHERMRRRLRSLGERVEQNYMRTFGLTVRALLLTLLLSLLWPTLIYYLGWRLQAEGASRFANSVGAGLSMMVAVSATIEVLRQIFRRRGLAESHFRWHANAVAAVRRNLTLFWPIATAAAFLVGFSETRSNDAWRTSIGRLAFSVGMIGFAFFMQQVMRPNGMVLKDVFANRTEGIVFRTRYWWYFAAIAAPATLAGLALEGHYFTAFQLTQRLLPSFWGPGQAGSRTGQGSSRSRHRNQHRFGKEYLPR